MAALKVTGAGLQLESSPAARDFLPLQAFGVTLDSSMIEDMIRSVQNGQDVELTLGSTPSFHYGSREEKVSAAPEAINYDLYLTDLAGSGNKTQRLPHPVMSILKKPPISLATKKATKITAKHVSRASLSGTDSDAEIRAAPYAPKSGKGSKLANGIPKGAKLLPAGKSAMASVLASTTTRSLPSSPALKGVSSPNPAFSASQQILEKNKGQRFALVHELAVRDWPFEHLQNVWTGAVADLKPTVEKVADFNKSTEKWSLKKRHWKELDVWNYEYDSPDDRQLAIDNAIKVYDKGRVALSDAVWDRLLQQKDRNKGIVLSKVQATIAKQSANIPAPKIAQKGEDENKSDIDSAKAKGEPMSRSNSQPIVSKPKKISEREAQTKRLLSNNPKKPAPKKPASKARNAKVPLSEETVYDSHSSGDEAPLSQSVTAAPAPKPKPQKPAEKPIEKQTARATEKPKEIVVPPASLKQKPKPIVRAPRAPVKAVGTINKSPQKRPRDDDDSSSSSGAPLSKRIKPKELPKPSIEPKIMKHRASDASQNSRGTNSTISSSLTMKSKNTSPTKSSPLTTTPPTNASDLDERPSSQRPPAHTYQQQPQQRNTARDRDRERGRGAPQTSTKTAPVPNPPVSGLSNSVVGKKRKERESVEESPDTTPTPPAKSARISVDVLNQARRFGRYYEKYSALHYEIAAMKDPPADKVNHLIDMHDRLAAMKNEIYRAAATAGA
ncbi:hypothetical protein F4777DRAFT_575438 [Nemania sp. FL0916]|nr:hypothetical protein F4777DRAFT_575438 [Nemania sp. FL0916]